MVVNKFIKFIIFSALTIILSVLISQFRETPQEASAAGANVDGWMWSDNVGWISLSSDNMSNAPVPYGITEQTSGDWAGYGWSDEVGWIRFDTGCPSGSEGQCMAKMIGTNLQGWARFCAGSSNGQCGSGTRPDGWDGWVSLSSVNDHDPLTPGVQTSPYNYGGTLSGVQVTGYVWGSTVAGWTQMVDVTVNQSAQSTLKLVPSTTTPTSGTIASLPTDLYVSSQTGSVVLSWYTADAAISYTSCTGSSPNSSNNWAGQTLNAPQVLPGFESRQNVTYNLNTANPSDFTITCTRATGGTDTATARVYRTQDCIVNLSGGGSFCADGPNARTPQLNWNAANASDCNAAWFTGTNATSQPVSGTQNVGAGSYQVTCHTPGSGAICTSNTEVVTQLDSNNPQCTATPQCSDHADNDHDGKIDFPQDPGCTSPSDNSETDSTKPTVIEH
jgi:hypothetical protein